MSLEQVEILSNVSALPPNANIPWKLYQAQPYLHSHPHCVQSTHVAICSLLFDVTKTFVTICRTTYVGPVRWKLKLLFWFSWTNIVTN